MPYTPKSMSQEEWDELIKNSPTPKPISAEKQAQLEREGRELMAAFCGNLNDAALESEAWHKNKPSN